MYIIHNIYLLRYNFLFFAYILKNFFIYAQCSFDINSTLNNERGGELNCWYFLNILQCDS